MGKPLRTVGSNLGVGLGAIGLIAFVVVACGSSEDSTFGNDAGSSGASGSIGSSGGVLAEGGADAGDTYANDPPPTYCVLPGQPTPPKPGGTEQCPDDKNLPGCACTTPGATAPCWTGKRVNRGLGQCQDGTTTCVPINEVQLGWSECTGQVLPTTGETKGKAACKCFSEGQWKINNLSPCFIQYSGTGAGTYAVSTIPDATSGTAACPTLPVNATPPPAKPLAAWSTDSLKVDCAGHFKLCYELKAGNYDSPSPSDCSLTKVCTEADYPTENTDQPFPDLPSWSSADAACAAKWQATGGYGEMSVVGESVLCDKIDDGAGKAYVFNRVRYCPSSCNENPSAPECASCQQGGSGSF